MTTEDEVSKNENLKLTVVTPQAIAAYAFVQRPRPALNPNSPPQYSVTLLFDKNDPKVMEGVKAMRQVAMNAARKKFGDLVPRGLRSPFRDGDAEKPDDPMFANKIFVQAKSNEKPGIVDANREALFDPNDFYSGCLCRASLYAFGYDNSGNRGVSFLLNNLQKLDDGNRMSGRRAAEDDFEAWSDGSGSRSQGVDDLL